LKRAQTVAKVGSWVFDIGSGRMHLSDETCHIFGVPAGTVGTHDSYLAKVHAQDRNDVERAWQAALRGAGFDHQHRVLNRDRTAWIHQSAELEFAPDGTALRAMGVVQDITEQKLAEQALRASEEKFAKVFLSSPMLVSISTRDEGRYIDVNDAFLHLLGHTREQVIGKTSRDIGIWKNPQDRQRAIDGLSSQQGANGTEVELCKRSGETVVCEVRGAPIDIDGTPCLIMVTHDITDRKKAEAALQESETRYRALVEWSPEPTLVHGGGRILYANPACIALFGASSAEELVGTPVIEVVHPDYRVFALARVKAMTETGINVPMVEELLVRRDGTPFEAEVQAKPIQYDGKPAIHIAMHDVSRRKREEAARLLLEAQLRESQKMQAIGTLAGGIAHDFNNIIATILGNAELAHQDAGANAAVQESLDEIRKAGARARDLVRQILSFSRREPPERRRIDLPPVIEESVRLLRATLPARVSLSVHCDPGVPPVLADRTQIEQVLINLATNAAQAMRDAPGHIDIHLNTVLLDATLARSHPALHALHDERPGRMVRIAVRDDGPGMDAATLGRIFEPFFTTKPVGEGTGLGLSVVHGIVQAHEGAILVESQPGRGTEFTVYLPVAGVA
jgi:PAS domain S-box-containing protein